MTHIDTKDWVVEGSWKIAPAGLDWVVEGSRLQIGYGATIGDDATIGSHATIESHATIGDDARIGYGARIGNGATIGYGARIGDGARIGSWARIGDGARIGDYTEESFEVGFADGYIKTICMVKGVAYIGAGCRWFTLAEALVYWKSKPNRTITMCLMQSAITIATLKGWRFDNDSK